jgi:hypothetical protein
MPQPYELPVRGRPAQLARSIAIWCSALFTWLLGNILGVVLHSSGVISAIDVVLAALWGVLILLMWLGQNWARVVQTVFARLGLISLLFSIIGAFSGIPGPGEGAGIVTIYRAPLNPYFGKRR